jgi:adenylate cyclase
MTAANDSSDVLTAEEIRDAVEDVITSPGFRRSPQLVAFLRFVVESALSGQAAYIKGYTIGIEALRRDKGFDPQKDPIVRVEAARLRKALASYYAAEGVRRSVTIDIPLGRYVPTFCRCKTHRPIAVLGAILMRMFRILRAPSRTGVFLSSVRSFPRSR